MGKRPHISDYIFPSLVVLGFTVVQCTTFVVIVSSRSISGGFSLFFFNHCLLVCRCPIVGFLYLSMCFLIRFYVIPEQVFRKPCLIALIILSAVVLKIPAYKNWVCSGFEVCSIMLFTTFSDCCGPIGTYHIDVFLFLVPLIVSSPFFWMDIYCLYRVMLHPSSYKTTNYINGVVYIFGKIWICLACFLRPGILSVAICVDFVVIPSGSLAFISFSIITVAIVWVACLARCFFAPESVIASMLVLVRLGGV